MRDEISTFLLGCVLASISSIACDVFTPSFPSMAKDLNSNTDHIQLAMSIMMGGCAISQLVYGPVSEGIGRKKTLIAGLLLSILGSGICCIAKNILTLFTGIFIMGVGVGCGSLYRCIFSDCYSGKVLSERGAYASLMYSIMIPCAPLLGGYLEVNYFWQANFVFLFISFILCTLQVLFLYKETNKNMNLSRIEYHYVKRLYQLILSHAPFRGYSYCTLLTMLGYFAWIITVPIFTIKNAGWSPAEFGVMMLYVTLSSMILGGFLNSIAIKYFSIDSIFKFAWILMLISGLLVIVAERLYGFNPDFVIAGMFIYFLASSFLWPNYYIQAFAPFHEQSGYANAVYGSMQLIGSSVSGFILAPLPEDSATALGCLITLTTALCWINYTMSIAAYEKREEC